MRQFKIKKMTKLKIGGVPEYFNLPIYNAIQKGTFAKNDIELKWTDVSEGTGAMSQMLRTNELDLAVILTEGITKSIIEGNPSRIIKNYVDSPLIWGVHSPYSSNFKSVDEINNKKIAISRFGSGSHLMSYLLAKRLNWGEKDFEFHIINNLEGARASFKATETNIFLWEKYTTEPYVDSKEFKRIDEVETPWPCFVIAANNKALSHKEEAIRKTCEIINESSREFQQKKNLNDIIANRFNISRTNASKIVKEIRWSKDTEVATSAIDLAIDTLWELNLIHQKVLSKEIVRHI